VEGTPLKALIVRIGAMGDVLHGLPAVAALRERLPDWFIGWAIEPQWSALLAADSESPTDRSVPVDRSRMPIVDRIHLVPARQWKQHPFSPSTLGGILKLRSEMHAEEYDLCIDLQGSIKSAVIGRLAGATRFLGPKEPRERQARMLYRELVAVQAAHVIEQACELLDVALTDTWDPVNELRPMKVTLPLDPAAESWCESRLQELGVGGEGFVLLAPTAGWGAKQWPIEKYRELAERMKAAGYTVLVNAGSADDLAATNELAAEGHATVVECNVSQLIALTRRAKLVIGGDTGPVHLASALGRPVVALFGPTDPRRNGPYFPGSRCRVLRHASSTSDHARHAETDRGLAKIREDEVISAAFGLLRESAHEGHAGG